MLVSHCEGAKYRLLDSIGRTSYVRFKIKYLEQLSSFCFGTTCITLSGTAFLSLVHFTLDNKPEHPDAASSSSTYLHSSCFDGIVAPTVTPVGELVIPALHTPFAVSQMSGDQGLSVTNAHAAQVLLQAPTVALENIV